VRPRVSPRADDRGPPADSRAGAALTAADLVALERLSRIEPGFPHDCEALGLTYGDTFPLVDDLR
jgi:hypothetical protein